MHKQSKLCPKCGLGRDQHNPPDPTHCPVPADVSARLRDFAKTNGRAWRSKLSLQWSIGLDVNDHLLRIARNMIGPGRIFNVKITHRD
jgi:hypothetical protein